MDRVRARESLDAAQNLAWQGLLYTLPATLALGSGAGQGAAAGRAGLLQLLPPSPLPPSLQIFFSDLSQDSAEDIFLTELKVKIQDSKLPKGEHRFPFRSSP